MDLSYILNDFAEERGDYFHAIAPPIIQSSNFDCKTVSEARRLIANEFSEHLYTRGLNPTVKILNEKLAALEGTESALTVSSGASAMALPILANVNQGDHIICVKKPYYWTEVLLTQSLPRFGVSCTFVDGTDVKNFQEAIQSNTKLIVLESPNSFTFELQDLAAVAALAKTHQLVTIIDNSYASPLFMQPAKFGIDIIVHSATKYIGGHSDVVAGVICGSEEMMRKIFQSEYMTFGTIIGPMDAWLLIRGLRTLEIRMERIASSTQQIVDALADHPKIERMIYPFHPSHPQFDLAKTQLSNGGGLFTMALKTDRIEVVEQFCDQLEGFRIAVSWGGHEALILPACIKFPTSEEAQASPAFNLIRFYIGLEKPDYLLKHILNALDKVQSIQEAQS